MEDQGQLLVLAQDLLDGGLHGLGQGVDLLLLGGAGLDVGDHHLLGGGLAVFIQRLVLVNEGVDVGGLQDGGGSVIQLGSQGILGSLFQLGNVDLHTGHTKNPPCDRGRQGRLTKRRSGGLVVWVTSDQDRGFFSSSFFCSLVLVPSFSRK